MNEKERLEKIEDIIDPRKRIGSKTFNFNDHYEYVKLTKDDEDFLVAKALTSGNSYVVICSKQMPYLWHHHNCIA